MKAKTIRSGVSQLTLAEHALCPLDARSSLGRSGEHTATFRYSDRYGKRQTATAQVFCPLGMSAKDELILWGLLAITLANPDSEGELHATRHYCMRRLGLIDSNRRGGRQYQDFSKAIARIAAIRYQCDAFYDPIRSEHRRMGFGFFSYSLPLDDDSVRAWRFTWDPLFFEIVQASGGYLRFDLATYERLDVASRRLFLLLCKLFYRRRKTPRLNVRDVAEQVIGVAPTVSLRHQKAKVISSIQKLRRLEIVRDARIRRVSKGRFELTMHRGAFFGRPIPEALVNSPLMEALIDLGMEQRDASRLIRRFTQKRVRLWLDITLAAQERRGASFFKVNPVAYLIDNLKHAANGNRMPPDWWQELQRAEERAAWKSISQRSEGSIEPVGDVLSTVMSSFVTPRKKQ